MRVIFAVPPGNLIRDTFYGCWHEKKIDYLWPPLNLAYYASSLSQDHEVKILDFQNLNLNVDEAINEIKKVPPDFLMIETGSLTFKNDLEFLKKVKKEIDVKTIISGVHVTVKPKESLKEQEIDYVIRGEPGVVLDELVEGNTNSQGICTKDKITPPLYVKNLDSLKFPKRDLLPNNYKNPLAISEPFTTFITSRGCSFKCNFCTSPAFYGDKFRKRSMENIISELVTLEGKYKEIFFRDENITSDKEFIGEICGEMLKERMNFDWMCNSRVDTVDKAILKKMKKSGCHLIKFGVESGSERILKNLGKNINLRRIRKTFLLCQELGIETVAHFMLGAPGETREDVEKTLKFSLKLNSNFASFDILIPLPGTTLYENLEKEDKISYEKIINYPEYTTKINERFCDVASEELLSLYNKAFRKFYFRPRIIFKNIKEVRSRKRFLDFSKVTIELWRNILR